MLAFRRHEQVARVRIGLEEARRRGSCARRCRIRSCTTSAGSSPAATSAALSVILMPSTKLHRQHAPRRLLAVDPRARPRAGRRRTGRARGRRCPPRAGSRARRPGASSARRAAAAARAAAVEPLVDAADAAQLRDVDRHDLLDVRVLHLHRHLAPVVEARAVHLGERGGGERRRLETRRTPRRAACRARARPPARISAKGFGGTASWQLLQPIDEGGREDVRARGDGLADLDDARRAGRARRPAARARRARGCGSSCAPLRAGAGRAGGARAPAACRGTRAATAVRATRSVRRSRGGEVHARRRPARARSRCAAAASSSPRGRRTPRAAPPGSAATCMSTVRLARTSSRCSLGAAAREVAQHRGGARRSTDLRPGSVPPSTRRSVRRGARRARCAGTRRAGSRRRGCSRRGRRRARAPPRPPGPRAARSPQWKVPSAKISIDEHAAPSSGSAAPSVSSSCGKQALPALAAAAGPIMRSSTSPGSCGLLEREVARGLPHLLVAAFVAPARLVARVGLEQSRSREVGEGGAVDRLDARGRAGPGTRDVADDRAEALDDRDHRERAHHRIAHAVRAAAASPGRRSGTAAASARRSMSSSGMPSRGEARLPGARWPARGAACAASGSAPSASKPPWQRTPLATSGLGVAAARRGAPPRDQTSGASAKSVACILPPGGAFSGGGGKS